MVLKSMHFRFMVKGVQVPKKLNETGVSSTETVMKANKTEWSSEHSTGVEGKCHGSRSYDYRFFLEIKTKNNQILNIITIAQIIILDLYFIDIREWCV